MNRKIVIGIICTTAAVNFLGFLYYLFTLMSYFRDPLAFKFMTLFLLMGMVIGLFVHMLLYVHFMDMKQRKFKIEDEEEWERKWDYDYKKS